MSTTVEFHELVMRDVKGELPEEQEALLYSDPENWCAELVTMVRDIDRQLSQRKSESLANGSKAVRKEFEIWRHGAIAFKTAVVERLSEAKQARKEFNLETDAASGSNHGATLLAILAELKGIREALAAK